MNPLLSLLQPISKQQTLLPSQYQMEENLSPPISFCLYRFPSQHSTHMQAFLNRKHNQGRSKNIEFVFGERLLNHIIRIEVQWLPPYKLFYILFIQGCLFEIENKRRWASRLLIDLMKTWQKWMIQCFLNFIHEPHEIDVSHQKRKETKWTI